MSVGPYIYIYIVGPMRGPCPKMKVYIGEKKRKEQSKHNCKMIYEWSGAIPLHYMSAPFHKGRKVRVPIMAPLPLS